MVSGINTLAYNGEMNWALLWLTARFLGHRTTILRLAAGASLGILPTLWVLLQQNLYAVPWELGLVWPVLMLAAAFPGLRRRFWFKSYGLFLTMTLLAGGLLAAGLNWMHWWLPGAAPLDWLLAVPLILLAAGRYLPKQRVRQMMGRESYGQVTLELGNRPLTVPVLWDSGNQLTDPALHRPVVIVEMASAYDWLPQEVLAWMLGATAANRDAGTIPCGWQGRLGVVSFRTLAGEGILPVVAVDKARGLYDDVWHPMVPVMVGVSRDRVAADGSYTGLASPKSLVHYPNERVGA